MDGSLSVRAWWKVEAAPVDAGRIAKAPAAVKLQGVDVAVSVDSVVQQWQDRNRRVHRSLGSCTAQVGSDGMHCDLRIGSAAAIRRSLSDRRAPAIGIAE